MVSFAVRMMGLLRHELGRNKEIWDNVLMSSSWLSELLSLTKTQ